MALDPQTLLVVNVVNLLALAILLPIIMGRALSPAAHAARLSLIVHAGAWIAVILSEACGTQWPNLALSAISMACFSGSNWLLYQALGRWLGPRRFARPLLALVVAMPLGYVLLFDSYAWRVGWSNGLIALQVAILASATLNSSSALHGRWRHALFICCSTMATLTLARGILGAFFSELYPNFAAPHPINLLALVVANATLVLTNVSVLVAWREEAEQQLRDQAMVDPLTTILNRRGWNEQAERAFANARRYRQPLALLSLDLDHFKRVNDEHGHEKGDEALRLFGQLMREQQRSGDIVARIGGEEFCVLLPMAEAGAARAFDHRLRSALHARAAATLGFPLDYSAGLACLADESELSALLLRSDEALYAAKDAGRGRLIEHRSTAAAT